MKKKIIGGAAVLAIVAIATINVSISIQKDNATSSLALENIEALAEGEVVGKKGGL